MAFVVFAVLFAGIGMARRNSLRYRAESFASINAGTLPADITGDYVWRVHPSGRWDTKLTLNKDGTFVATQDEGGRYVLTGDGRYSVSGRVVSLRYRHRPRGWSPAADFKWAILFEIEGEVVMVPDQSCEKYFVGDDAARIQGFLSIRSYLTRNGRTKTVLEPLRELVGDNLRTAMK